MDDDLSSSGSEKDESSISTKEEEKEIKNNKTETLLEIPSVIPSTSEKEIEGHSLTIENKEKESWFILFGRLNCGLLCQSNRKLVDTTNDWIDGDCLKHFNFWNKNNYFLS